MAKLTDEERARRRAESKARYAAKNADKIKARLAKWRAANPEKAKAGAVKRAARWAKANPEKKKAAYAKWRAANPERVKALGAKWVAANPEKKRAADARWRAENQERLRAEAAKRYAANAEKCNARMAEWRATNPEKVNAVNAKRRAAKLQAYPAWLSAQQVRAMRLVYAEAVRRTKETGVIYHVDHIVPLLGKNVRGLHVPWNLRVLSATDNCLKGAAIPKGLDLI